MKVITIGRSTENNDIVVDDVKVSRNHLQMVMDDNGNYSVMDLGSTNGTYVNGQRISGEVRLQLGDEVRIGQTVLPWQNYFATPIVEPSLSPRPPKGPNRTWLYVIIGAALLLLIGGGVAWKVYHDKQKEKIEQEEQDKKDRQERQLEQEANDARVEAARLSEEAEAAARIAAETQSEKDLQYAKQMHDKAQEAKKLAQEKEAEWNKMKAELEEARTAQQEAEAQNEIAQQAKEDAERNADEANAKAKQAEKDKEYAQEESKLIKTFYSLISDAKSKDFKNICKALRWTPMKDEDEKGCIIRRFDKGDNAQKKKIIDTIKIVLDQQNPNEGQAESNPTNKTDEQPVMDNNNEQPAPNANDTVKQ